MKFSFVAKGPVNSSPAIITDGTVYFVSSEDGAANIYALVGNSPLADTPWPKFRRDLPNTGRE